MQPGPRQRPIPTFAAAILGTAALALGFHAAAPLLPLPGAARFAAGYACLVAGLLAVARAAPPVGRRGVAAALVPAVLPVVVWLLAPGDRSIAGALGVLVGLLAAGALVGAFLGGEIEAPGHLLPVAFAASLADLASVLAPSGPTATVIEHRPDVLAVVALPWSFGDGRFVPVLGVGDVIMTALYLAACRRHALDANRATIALGAAYAVLLVALLVAERPLPALPALGLAVVTAFPEARRVPPRDRAKALVVMGLLGVATAWALAR